MKSEFRFLVLSALAGVSAHGATVTVLNPSFEANVYATAGDASLNHTSWTDIAPGDAGTGRSAISQYTSGVPDGFNYAFTNQAVDGLSQVLPTLLVANTTYTLTVAIGWRNDLQATWPNFPGYGIELWAGSTKLASAYHDDPGALSPARDSWIDVTATYTSPSSVTAAPLEIRLLAGDAVNGGTAIQTNFDNVRLDAIPEPSAALLGGIGALLLLRRRK